MCHVLHPVLTHEAPPVDTIVTNVIADCVIKVVCACVTQSHVFAHELCVLLPIPMFC